MPHVLLTYDIDENPGRLTDAEKRAFVCEFEDWLGLSVASRLIMRDRAVKRALDCYAGLALSRAAKQLEIDLRRYREIGWQRESALIELPAATSELRRAWHQILRLNGGRSLSWSQILRIQDGHRG
jgi:hypothetical protein